MHKLVEVSLGGKLNLAPVSRDPKRVLDIGTGTGIWAIEMGRITFHVDSLLLLRKQKVDNFDVNRRSVSQSGGMNSQPPHHAIFERSRV